MTKLRVRIYGDSCLRKKCDPIGRVGQAEKDLITSMLETMYEHKGIGLAAPQVGILKRIFVADIGSGPIIFINPKIIKKTGSEKMEEGCLSIPEVVVDVKRPVDILVRYMDEEGQTVEKEYSGLMARVIQHETDHLNGRLIVDYAGFRKRFELRKHLKNLTLLAQES